LELLEHYSVDLFRQRRLQAITQLKPTTSKLAVSGSSGSANHRS
jgi:hypothetical protein